MAELVEQWMAGKLSAQESVTCCLTNHEASGKVALASAEAHRTAIARASHVSRGARSSQDALSKQIGGSRLGDGDVDRNLCVLFAF